MIVPQIGATGTWSLLTPYNTLLHPGVEYTCIAVRRLIDFVKVDTDPYELYYEPYGLSVDVYNKSVAAGVSVVTLQGADGDVAYIPNDYIAALPSGLGILYATIGLAASLGPLPVTTDLTDLSTRISELVKTTVGVTSEVKKLNLSPPTLVDYESDASISAARKAAITANETDYARALRLESELAETRERLRLVSQSYAEYRRDHPPNPPPPPPPPGPKPPPPGPTPPSPAPMPTPAPPPPPPAGSRASLGPRPARVGPSYAPTAVYHPTGDPVLDAKVVALGVPEYVNAGYQLSKKLDRVTLTYEWRGPLLPDVSELPALLGEGVYSYETFAADMDGRGVPRMLYTLFRTDGTGPDDTLASGGPGSLSVGVSSAHAGMPMYVTNRLSRRVAGGGTIRLATFTQRIHLSAEDHEVVAPGSSVAVATYADAEPGEFATRQAVTYVNPRLDLKVAGRATFTYDRRHPAVVPSWRSAAVANGRRCDWISSKTFLIDTNVDQSTYSPPVADVCGLSNPAPAALNFNLAPGDTRAYTHVRSVGYVELDGKHTEVFRYDTPLPVAMQVCDVAYGPGVVPAARDIRPMAYLNPRLEELTPGVITFSYDDRADHVGLTSEEMAARLGLAQCVCVTGVSSTGVDDMHGPIVSLDTTELSAVTPASHSGNLDGMPASFFSHVVHAVFDATTPAMIPVVWWSLKIRESVPIPLPIDPPVPEPHPPTEPPVPEPPIPIEPPLPEPPPPTEPPVPEPPMPTEPPVPEPPMPTEPPLPELPPTEVPPMTDVGFVV